MRRGTGLLDRRWQLPMALLVSFVPILAFAHPDTAHKRITLTIYDQDFAMVSEQRALLLQSGANAVYLPDISPLIDPQSVLVQRAKTTPLRPELTACTYELGVQSGQPLIRRYVGKQVQFI